MQLSFQSYEIHVYICFMDPDWFPIAIEVPGNNFLDTFEKIWMLIEHFKCWEFFFNPT